MGKEEWRKGTRVLGAFKSICGECTAKTTVWSEGGRESCEMVDEQML